LVTAVQRFFYKRTFAVHGAQMNALILSFPSIGKADIIQALCICLLAGRKESHFQSFIVATMTFIVGTA
jgi:hypothetical protein